VVSAHHVGDVGTSVFVNCARGTGCRSGAKKGAAASGGEEQFGIVQSPPRAPLGVSCGEIRRLFWQLVVAVERGAEAVLEWSRWRRWHQAWARYHHYKRRNTRATSVLVPSSPTPALAYDLGEVSEEVDDACWARLEPIVPHPKPGGTQKGYTRRQFVEAYAYRLQHGCGWRDLPIRFPPWHTVYERVRKWREADVLDKISAMLCTQPSGAADA
jgi:transposase